MVVSSVMLLTEGVEEEVLAVSWTEGLLGVAVGEPHWIGVDEGAEEAEEEQMVVVFHLLACQFCYVVALNLFVRPSDSPLFYFQ